MKKRRPHNNKTAKTSARPTRKAGPERQPAAAKSRPSSQKRRLENQRKEAAADAKKFDQGSPPSDRAFSWYPGHMVKAKRELESNLKLADAVLLMLDARAPVGTRHPDLEVILAQRYTPFVLVLNKADLADPAETEKWRTYLKSQGHKVVEMSALKGHGTGPLTPMLDQVDKEINLRRSNKGLLPRNVRLMVAGLPNSGKSTLLNRLVGQGRFKTGKKPGLTRGAQWVTVAGRYQLLDTPGILYPRIEGERALAVLAAIGSVRRDILPLAQVVRRLLKELDERGRLLELLPKFEGISEKVWTEQPLECLAQSWGFVDSEQQLRRGFDRFLNLFAEKAFRITWETAPNP